MVHKPGEFVKNPNCEWPHPLPRMIRCAMGIRQNACEIQLSFFAALILVLEIQGFWSLNSEGNFCFTLLLANH